jgi:Leucine-rich repeat (LRR) protein
MVHLPQCLWECIGSFLLNRDVPHLLLACPSAWREKPHMPVVWNGKMDCPPSASNPVHTLLFTGLPQHAWGEWGKFKVRIHQLCTASMPGLVHVDLSNTLVKSLKPLRHCVQLRSVKCEFTPVYSLAGLEWCPELREIRCRFTNVCALTPLRQCPELAYVDCSHTKVNSLLPLLHCPQLLHMCADHTHVRSLSGLEKCVDLRVVSCRMWQPHIHDLSPLHSRALEVLDLTIESPVDDVPVTSLECLGECPALHTLRLLGHRLSCVTPLLVCRLSAVELCVQGLSVSCLLVRFPGLVVSGPCVVSSLPPP